MRRGGKSYFAANLVAQASALARYVLLARLLGPEELGLAAILILTAQFFESISDTGSDRFLVQDEDGDSPVMQGFVQLVLAGRGLLIAAALCTVAVVLAGLDSMPDLRMSLVALAAAPLIGGLTHLDLRRVQRQSDFRPEGLAMMVSETLSLIATGVAAWIVRDHTAVVYGLVVRAIALVAVSHLTATRPYRWAFGRIESRRFTAFAAPLALNGVLLFFGSQGDRLVVGGGLGAAALGHYSAVLLLVYYPASMLTRFLAGIHMPQLAAARPSPAAFAAVRDRLGSRTLWLTCGIVAGFALVAPFFTPLFYGARFAEPFQVFALLGVLQAARFMRFWPTTLAVAVGRSTIVMLNNVARMVALPVALAANLRFHALEAIVMGFIVGEVLALLVALWLLKRAGALDLPRELGRVGLFAMTSVAVIGAAWNLQAKLPYGVVASLALGGAVAVALVTSERSTLAEMWGVVTRRFSRLARPL